VCVIFKFYSFVFLKNFTPFAVKSDLFNYTCFYLNILNFNQNKDYTVIRMHFFDLKHLEKRDTFEHNLKINV
jgi:hypothetical protein